MKTKIYIIILAIIAFIGIVTTISLTIYTVNKMNNAPSTTGIFSVILVSEFFLTINEFSSNGKYLSISIDFSAIVSL